MSFQNTNSLLELQRELHWKVRNQYNDKFRNLPGCVLLDIPWPKWVIGWGAASKMLKAMGFAVVWDTSLDIDFETLICLKYLFK